MGNLVGASGSLVGGFVGRGLGAADGASGSLVGSFVGETDGYPVVGKSVGRSVGLGLGGNVPPTVVG